MSEQKPVFKVGDGYVDPNGNPVKADGTPIKTASTEATDTTAQDDRIKQLEADLKAAQKNALPADARDRLIAVKGMGEKLADEALAALKG